MYCNGQVFYESDVMYHHGLRTPNEGINQRYLKNWADVADKIRFGLTWKFGIGIEFSAMQWRLWALWASVVRGPNRPTAVQGYQGTITKVPRLFQGPLWISVVMVFVVSNVMTYLLQLTIFARKEAQLWTTSAEYRWLIFRYSSLFTILSMNLRRNSTLQYCCSNV